MADKKVEAFSVEVPVGDPEKMKAFQEAMDEYHDALDSHIRELGEELGLSYAQACDIYYLRTRSRHTEELEERVIAAMKAGHSIRTLDGNEDAQLQDLGF